MGFYIFERLVAVKPRTKTNFGYGASCRKKGKRSNYRPLAGKRLRRASRG